MKGLKINLLPNEILTQEVSQKQKSLKIRVCIFLILVTVIGSLSLLSLRYLQNIEDNNIQTQVTNLNIEASNYKDREQSLVSLKKRLEALHQLAQIESKQSSALNLVTTIAPPSVQIVFLGVDKRGRVTLTGQSSSALDIQLFLDQLVDIRSNQGKIQKVSLESLNKLGQTDLKFDLAITLK